MCNQAVDNYVHALEFVPECYKTQEMCDKAVNTYPSTIKFGLECHKIQEICDKADNRCFLYFIYCPYTCKTKRMCDEAVDDCLTALKFIPDWFVTNKMLEKFHDAVNAKDDVIFFYENFIKVTFFAYEMAVLGVDLDKINLDSDNFNEDDPDTLIHTRLLAWHFCSPQHL